jgi:hypothetical protein
MRIYPHIHNAEELGIAVLGNRFTNIAPREIIIDRADYGRSLAKAEGGIFTSRGYIVPDKEGEVYGE